MGHGVKRHSCEAEVLCASFPRLVIPMLHTGGPGVGSAHFVDSDRIGQPFANGRWHSSLVLDLGRELKDDARSALAYFGRVASRGGH